jgi:hypothetical protein
MKLRLSLSTVTWPNHRALRPAVKPSVHAKFRAGTLVARDALDVVLFGVTKGSR